MNQILSVNNSSTTKRSSTKSNHSNKSMSGLCLSIFILIKTKKKRWSVTIIRSNKIKLILKYLKRLKKNYSERYIKFIKK